ncbi:MAG TPA: S41 family peptidase, partial [Clostridia bacterium]|nr:S41 family peptidase [Clostridia bacterium]
GNVEYAERIASTIIGDELIYYTKDRYGLRLDKYADGVVMEEPLVLICNENSASSSEILLGAVQAHKAGTIVGTTSFGKGIIQSVMNFPEGDGLQVTVAQYFTPDDKTIHGVGVTPDVEVALAEDAYGENGQLIPEKDNQLSTAVEVLMEQLEADKAA